MHYTTTYQSPLGGITLAADGEALTGLWFEGQKYFALYLDKEHEEKDLPVFEQTKQWLDIYFSGRNPDFTPPMHFTGSDFQNEVWAILAAIPYGKTRTYGDIAREMAAKRGLSRMSAQAVGGEPRAGRRGQQHPLPPRGGHEWQPDGICRRHSQEDRTAPAGGCTERRILCTKA